MGISRFASVLAVVAFGCASPAPAGHDAGATRWDDAAAHGPIIPETAFQEPDAGSEGGRKLGTIFPYAFPIGAAGGDFAPGATYPNPTVSQCTGTGGSGGTCSLLAGTIAFSATAAQTLFGGPVIGQVTPASDVATLPMTILAQGAFGTATTNKTGANLILESGGGANTNGTTGNVGVTILAGSGSGTSGTFSTNIAAHTSFLADNQGVVLGRTDASQTGMRIAPLIGQETTYAGVWTGAAATAPTGANYKMALAVNSGADFWSATGITFGQNSQFTIALTNSTTAQVTWQSVVTAPLISQAALTTASGTGATFTLQAQNETGTTSTGGTLALTSGTGTSANGPVQLQTGGTNSLTIGPTATSGGPAAIGLANQSVTITASSNTTFTLTTTQYQAPMILLTGTLTSAAVATVAFPNVTAFWWVDYSGVTFTSGSVNFKCGAGAASASVSSLVTTSEIAMVSCRGTTVSIHTENDALPLPDWRYAANDNGLEPCDERRRVA